eukprot:CAMPEP_0183805326 /NCGR_PEP_ID=MMETSP0803_2-20130417/36996_1 /TAXON_ID=195967 /ORGANISM="Crustomastix stigmata, Strain CCMP3273" /LENGTH=94 /DNA_ID=CAMNT_0026050083 /DNA_START=99 /DNA_END=379 /DNA_ORIENTATION=+
MYDTTTTTIVPVPGSAPPPAPLSPPQTLSALHALSPASSASSHAAQARPEVHVQLHPQRRDALACRMQQLRVDRHEPPVENQHARAGRQRYDLE